MTIKVFGNPIGKQIQNPSGSTLAMVLGTKVSQSKLQTTFIDLLYIRPQTLLVLFSNHQISPKEHTKIKLFNLSAMFNINRLTSKIASGNGILKTFFSCDNGS